MTAPDKQPGDFFITLRVPSDLHGEIRRLAIANDRTIAAEIRLAMRARLDQHKAGSK